MTTHLNDQPFEVLNTRVIASTPERLFAAFSNPDNLKNWWGPNGFTNTIQQFDFRPGGAWHIVMHGPDGTDYPNESQFVDIVKPERIVFEHLRPMHWYRMTMTFAEESGSTTLSWRMEFNAGGENEQLKGFITAANEQNFDRLEAHLTSILQVRSQNPIR